MREPIEMTEEKLLEHVDYILEDLGCTPSRMLKNNLCDTIIEFVEENYGLGLGEEWPEDILAGIEVYQDATGEWVVDFN